MNPHPWPKTIGVDEHSSQRRRRGNIPFVTLLVDYVNKKPLEVVDSKNNKQLKLKLHSLLGQDNVKNVIFDLFDPFKNFAEEFFPNAELKELNTLAKTLHKWAEMILNYFQHRLTNGRTEGFNNKAKLVKRRAYGYRNFENYRRRVLCACF
jgi:transposase